MVHVPSPPELVVRPLQRFRWRDWAALALVWFASLILAAVVAWVAHGRVAPHGSAAPGQDAADVDALRERITVLERADQVARAANADLQHQIAQRQDEVASLRADLAFYSRLTDASSVRDGLAVEALKLESAAAPRLYNFTLTLTQSLKPGQVAGGRARLVVAGMRGERMTTLAWSDLAGDQDANGLAFSFKYFQQIKGTLLLPEGFVPNAIHVEADGGAQMGKAERDFRWSEVSTSEDASHAG